MMSNNRALARFITSLGSFNEYGSTLLQTKEALDLRSTKVLKQDGDDVAIFEDALKGIGKIKQLGFNTNGIIAVNKEFDSKSDEQPKWPGHLRNAYHNEMIVSESQRIPRLIKHSFLKIRSHVQI